MMKKYKYIFKVFAVLFFSIIFFIKQGYSIDNDSHYSGQANTISKEQSKYSLEYKLELPYGNNYRPGYFFGKERVPEEFSIPSKNIRYKSTLNDVERYSVYTDKPNIQTTDKEAEVKTEFLGPPEKISQNTTESKYDLYEFNKPRSGQGLLITVYERPLRENIIRNDFHAKTLKRQINVPRQKIAPYKVGGISSLGGFFLAEFAKWFPKYLVKWNVKINDVFSFLAFVLFFITQTVSSIISIYCCFRRSGIHGIRYSIFR